MKLIKRTLESFILPQKLIIQGKKVFISAAKVITVIILRLL